MSDPQWKLRRECCGGHAAWALGRLNTQAARAALEALAARDPDVSVQAEARYALDMLN